jgi:hypothetical protein
LAHFFVRLDVPLRVFQELVDVFTKNFFEVDLVEIASAIRSLLSPWQIAAASRHMVRFLSLVTDQFSTA